MTGIQPPPRTLEEAVAQAVADGVRDYLREIHWRPDLSLGASRMAPGVPPHLMPDIPESKPVPVDVVKACAAELDRVGVSVEYGRDRVRKVLTELGLPGYATGVLDAAIAMRRGSSGVRAVRSGRPPRSAS